MQIHQFSASYQPEQDRILLRVLTFDDVETLLWFTRRLMARLWPTLQRLQADALLQREPASVVQASPAPLRQMLTDYRRQELRQSADFATPYRAPAAMTAMAAEVATPSTATVPLLVTHVDVQPGAEATWQLQLAERLDGDEASGRRFALSLDIRAMEGVMHLLEQALFTSQWEHPFAAAASPAHPGEATRDDDPTDEGAAVPRPRLLN
jgi:hypothetical protein